MKILMIAPQPFFEPRGTPFSVLGRLKGLSHLGHEVDLVTYHVGRDVAVPGVKIHRTPRIGFIKSVKVGPSFQKLFLDVLVFFKALQLLRRNKYNLLHTHEEASFFGVLLARIFKIRHLYDMHSSPPQQLKNFHYMSFGPLISLFEWIEAKVIGSSDAVITICPALEDYVRRVNGDVPSMMIENVGNEQDYDSVADNEVEALISAYPKMKNKKVILYTGTFEHYQGLDLLVRGAVQVVRQHKDVLFLMVGGKPRQVRHYNDQVEEMGLAENFLFTGIRPPEEMPAFVKLSDLLVSPRTEGTNTPLKIYSYLHSGKPIVATDLYTHTQVLNSQVAVLVEPNPEAFAQGLIELLGDPALSAGLAQRARRFFEERYSFKTFVQKTDQVLQMALGQRAGGTDD